MIKAVIFDCFGVLTADRWLEFCKSIDDPQIRETARGLNYQYDSGKMSLESFLDQVCKLTGSDRAAVAGIFISPQIGKNNELIDYIRSLKAQYKIGMLSNVATNWVREVLLDGEEQRLFDAMVFSFEVGAGKPDSIMYETVLEKLDVKAEEAVFIDDLARYVDGAQKLGIQSVIYENFDQMKKELEEILAAGADN